jgi:hypothetical protein
MQLFVKLYENDQHSLSGMVHVLSEIIVESNQIFQQVQTLNLSNKYANIADKLKNRKMAQKKTERIVHFFKDPSDNLLNLNYQLHQEEISSLK